ncbi:putative membrane protein DUF2306 [Paenibacillus methanolicus]|uniref:Putative membrane protein DUF2306 n=1 Tax=Paenibacillus methanolicus TaxID=582686 RepID=A0A5S5C605_9BACL|nr:putative membrane protein DUF2306 [Paenibacillus methanolicus]
MPERLERRETFYLLIASVVLLYILYALLNNYVLDPGAEAFLGYKTDLKRELKPSIWLKVMYVHVGFACVAMASGLANFSRYKNLVYLRSDASLAAKDGASRFALVRGYARHRGFHRANGYVYVASVLIVVLTSGYMAPYATGGKVSGMGFNLLNILWLIATTTALVHIFKKRVVRHRQWMLRSYAFCFTNMLIHLLAFVLHDMSGIAYVTSYTIGVYGAIALVLAVPELLIRAGARSKN